MRPYEEAAEPAGWLDGTDPAVRADTGNDLDPFPPALDVEVRPADGAWTDPRLIGARRLEEAEPADPVEAYRADLAAADGDPEAGWAALHGSDDPAIRALAARWHG